MSTGLLLVAEQFLLKNESILQPGQSHGSFSSPIRLPPDFDPLIVSLLYVLRASADESSAVLNFAYKGFSCLRPSHTLSTVPVPSAVMIYHVHRRPSELGELQASLVLVTAGFLSSCAFNKAPVFGFLLLLPDLLSAV